MKKELALKIGQVFYWLLLAVSVLLVVLFYIKNGSVNTDDSWSKQTAEFGPILNYYIIWAYILVGLAIFFTLVFPLGNMIAHPKSGLKTLAFLAGLALLLFIGYQLADDTILQLPGYTGSDNVPQRLKLAGMGIYMMYFTLAGALLAMLFSSIRKLFN
ncbi:MAG: hypothetical protein J7L96_09225 [Bacteroidales bacterium]|nr:hypothetical protein [Bacteroidales bacterium]